MGDDDRRIRRSRVPRPSPRRRSAFWRSRLNQRDPASTAGRACRRRPGSALSLCVCEEITPRRIQCTGLDCHSVCPFRI
jgi:hypothetical protein